MKNKVPSKKVGQRGVVLGLLAILLIPLIVILIGLGIDVTRAKYASSFLRQKVEDVCRDLSEQITTQQQAALIFQERMNALSAMSSQNGFKITNARLVMPTMSPEPLSVGSTPQLRTRPYIWRDSDSRKNACRDVNSYDADPWSPSGLPDNEVEFTSLGFPCNLDNGGDCKFVSNLCANAATESHDPNYPVGLWGIIEDAGAAVGCEIEGEVNRILPVTLMPGQSDAPIVARVVWAAEPPQSIPYNPSQSINWFDDEFNLLHMDDVNNPQPNIPYRPLSIVVAPQYFIPQMAPSPAPAPSLDALKFESSVVDYSLIEGLGDEFRKRYDPLFPTSTPDFFAAANPAIPGISNQIDFPTGDDLTRMKIACMNPPVLIRSIFSSLLAEFASRHGNYRFQTEALIAQIIYDPNAPTNNQNYPILLSEFGEDIARNTFQPPYLSFRYPSGFTPPYPGVSYWSDPLDPIPASNDSFGALVAGQLRNCYHLYRSDIAATASPRLGLQRYFDPSLMGGILANSGFEPPFLASFGDTSVYPREMKFSITSPNPITRFWHPSGGAWSKFLGAGQALDTTTSRNLSLGETLAMLGSVQLCPKEDGVCTQNEALLEPNLYSVVRYLTRRDDLLAITAQPNAYALKAPGYWTEATPPFSPGNPPPNGPAFDDPLIRELAPNRKSTVVIFTHYGPSSSQITAIGDLINTNPLRIFKIIFIPTTGIDIPTHRQNIIDAFKIPTTPNDATSELFELSPVSPSLARMRPPRSYPSGEIGFEQYWFDLLGYRYGSNPGDGIPSDMYIGEIARKFFYQRLANPVIRY